MENKICTLFGGALNITDSIEYLETVKIGEMLAEREWKVKNGGYRGMMEAVSKGVHNKGGHVTGYTCLSFGSPKGNKYLSETVPCKDLYERLECLITGTNLFVIQRGGIGTLAEVFIALDLIRKMKENKPTVVFFGTIWLEILKGIDEHIFSESERNLILICHSLQDFQDILDGVLK